MTKIYTVEEAHFNFDDNDKVVHISDYDKLREAAKDFIAGEITVGEFEAVIYGGVQPDTSLMDKTKVCEYCKGAANYHFEKCPMEGI